VSDTKPEVDPQPPLAKEKRPRDPHQWVHRPMNDYRKPKYALDFRPTPAFFEVADAVIRVKPRRTLLGYDRLYAFWQALQNVIHVPGAIAEVGSYRGGSAYFLAGAVQKVMGEDLPFHVFDTFAGHPPDAITAADEFHAPGNFNETSLERVRELLSPFPEVRIHQGDVSATLPGLAESAYRFVHVDTDLYQPTLVCLGYFGARLSPGGVIVIDDYAARDCPGVPKAVAEYLGDTDAFPVWDLRTEQLMLVKR
jgi:hypothetical protein